MSQYVHHVPGRLRIRSKAFRCSPSSVEAVQEQLRATAGVVEVRHNPRIGSVTVQYDPATDAGRQVLQAFADAGCLPLGTSAPAPGAGESSELAATFGKAIVTALAQQAVSRSFGTLASAVLR